jgi:hypothetical protein
MNILLKLAMKLIEWKSQQLRACSPIMSGLCSDVLGEVLSTAPTASTADGNSRQHEKFHNTGLVYTGRSYNVDHQSSCLGMRFGTIHI